MTKVSIEDGFSIRLESFNIVKADVTEDAIAEDSLIYLDKTWYSNFFKEKRMVDERGQKLPSHPNFGLTPVRMTRSKTAMKKQKTGGFYCDRCHKTLKTAAWLVRHKCS